MTILKAILNHAKTKPEKFAFSYVEGRHIDQLIISEITYRELFVRANFLSLKIQEKCQQGDRVLLCYPAGLDFIVAFYACLMAKVIAVPVVLPTNLGLTKKFTAIFKDVTPNLLLTDLKTQENYLQLDHIEKFEIDNHQFLMQFLQVKCIATDRLPLFFDLNLGDYQLPDISLDDTAFLQYTSGSTSSPKGVVVTHRNLADNLMLMQKAYHITESDRGVSWLPHTHDMGLVGSLLLTSYSGASLSIMPQSLFIRFPALWLQYVSRFKLTVAMAPNFALDFCVNKIKSEHCVDLNLSALKCFIIGAEPISAEILSKFTATFALYGFDSGVFAPSYGLAEATLMVSSGFGVKTLMLKCDLIKNNVIETVVNNGKTLVSCGLTKQSVKIVNPNTKKVCQESEIGEIWISGSSVTKGYWNKKDLTEFLYQNYLPGDNLKYFRTGDLGFINEGELYVTGRLKDLIIVNGLNYYPQDIEYCVQNSHEALGQESVVAFAYRDNIQSDTDSFVILIKKQRAINEDDLEIILVNARMAVMKEFQLIPHDIQFVDKNFPKTTSGKIQRNLCAQIYLESLQQAAQGLYFDV